MRKRKRINPLPNDSDTLSWLQDATPNRTAMSKRQRYEAKRVRVRLDVPPEVKEALALLASKLSTSSSQVGALLLAWGLLQYQGGDRGIHRGIEKRLYLSGHPRVEKGIDLSDLITRLEKAVQNGVRELESE